MSEEDAAHLAFGRTIMQYSRLPRDPSEYAPFVLRIQQDVALFHRLLEAMKATRGISTLNNRDFQTSLEIDFRYLEDANRCRDALKSIIARANEPTSVHMTDFKAGEGSFGGKP